MYLVFYTVVMLVATGPYCNVWGISDKSEVSLEKVDNSQKGLVTRFNEKYDNKLVDYLQYEELATCKAFALTSW